MKFIPVVDDFERAMNSIPEEDRGNDWLKGFDLILKKLHTILDAEGVQEIDPLGEPFDPNFHEVIGVDDSATDVESEHVSAVLQKGYKQGERVLRPAMVRVAG